MSIVKAFFSVFEAKQKTTLLMLVIFVVVLAAIQATGVGAILPIVTLLVKPEFLLEHPLGAKLFQYSEATSTGEFTVMLLIGYGAIYLTIQLATSLLNFLQYRFVNYFQLSISIRMLQGYFANDYLFFLNNNSTILLKNITQESPIFSRNLVFSLLSLFSNALILLAIGIFMTIVAPVVTLSIFALGGIAYLTLFKRMQHKLQSWAKERDEYMSGMNLTAQQTLSGAKEIIVYGCKTKFITDYYDTAAPSARLTTRYNTISACLPLWINSLVFGGAVILLGGMQWYGLTIANYLPLLAMIGVGFSRILPLINNIINAIISIRYYWVSFDNVIHAMGDIKNTDNYVEPESIQRKDLPPLSKELSFHDLHFRYPEAQEDTLYKINLSISKGSKVAFVGESGAGKSTLVDIILGLLWSNSGHIAIDNQPLDAENIDSWRKQIGYVPQQTYILDGTLKENIAFGLNSEDTDDEKILSAINKSNLGKLLDTLRDGLDTQMGEHGARLSGGERQRIGIARALYHNPEVLILDEPTSALDAMNEQQIIDEMVGLKGITVIIVSHRISSVKFCDTIVVFDKGTVACEGSYESLIENCALFESMDNAWGSNHDNISAE